MKKADLFFSFIIAEAVALISFPILKFLALPHLIMAIAQYFPIILPLGAIFGIWFTSILGKKILALFQAAKMFLVGILNTMIDFGILNLLMWFFNVFAGWSYLFFKGFSFSVSVINSYFWNKYWTFQKKETGIRAGEFGKFYLIALGGLLIHISVAHLVVNVIGPQFITSEKVLANFGALLAVFFGFFWSFFGYKFIVFKK